MRAHSLVRWAIALFLSCGVGLAAVSPPGAAASGMATRAADPTPDVNLGHLDFLHDTVPYTSSATHSTTDPGTSIDTWWVYANYDAGTGTYTRTGGGAYDAGTNTYGQGAFDTDDVARAAVVYLTHYRYYHDAHSLQYARGALRFVLYMQTLTGPNAGNFVLWMQPDGSLNPTPTPPDSPNPSDAGASYWLARSLWALGDGYDVFRRVDRAFAAVLRQRMELAMSKLDAELIAPNLGHYYTIHGYQTPKWLIADGADASSEAMLGLVPYYGATGSPEARRLLDAFGGGIAGLQFGTVGDWPWQALMPWALSVSDWHAWGAHMAMALAQAGSQLGRGGWLAAANRDSALFKTHLLASFGPVNGLLPAPDDLSQIAYGAETTTDGLLYTGRATGNRAYRVLAGIAAAWFFGNNPAGAAMYQPDTGVVYDGINADGTINHNSGAESTIEGLYALMNVYNDPLARRALAYHHIVAQTTYQKVEAESGTLSGAATVITPTSAWTGEAQWSNGAYVDLTTGGSVTISTTAPADGRYLLYVVYDKQIAPAGAVGVRVDVDGTAAGTDDEGGAGAQGDSPNPDYLWIDRVAVPQRLTAGPHTVTLTYAGSGAIHAKVDAIMLQPVIEDKVLADDQGDMLALYKSLGDGEQAAALPASAASSAWSARLYDRNGQPRGVYHVRAGTAGTIPVLPYGFTIAATGPSGRPNK